MSNTKQTESPFLLPEEVDAISRLSAITRWRREKQGLFPKRLKLSARKIAYDRAAVMDWSKDPEGWAARNSGAV